MVRKTWACVLALFLGVVYGDDRLPVEAYAQLPKVSHLAISPQGTRVAMRIVDQGRDMVVVIETSDHSVAGAINAEKVNSRDIRFANEDVVILTAGGTYKNFYVRNAYDHSNAYAFDVSTKELRTLLIRAKQLYPFQSGIGRIVGRNQARDRLYMPAHVTKTQGSSATTYGYLEVPLASRSDRLVEWGTPHTVDWFLDAEGEPIVREDFNDRTNVHKLWRIRGGKKNLLREQQTERPEISVVGLLPDRSALVFRAAAWGTDVDKYFTLDIEDGSIDGPILGRDDIDIQHVVTDINRIVLGVRYTGFLPEYQFLDEALDARVREIQSRLPNMYSELVSWTDDFETLLFYVSGSWTARSYLLFENGQEKPKLLGNAYEDIEREYIATVRIGEYEASDGLTIPMLVTAKDDVYGAGKAPLILMPHGGPEAHDEFGFDWMAQFFASRGYVVLQPQFRGSTGFGNAHRIAGYGEWGRKMQTDLDEGVQHLVQVGIADPDRVCVVGASYGGYAALAAGAFSAFDYRCIVSLAGVSDIEKMLKSEARQHGRNDWIVSYWEDQVGSGRADKEFLRSISPARHADAFEAPVLLLHGRDDTVVLSDQSRRMHRALKKADKDVTYELLKGEDHWLTQPETRLEALRYMAVFVEKHNPVH